MPSHMVVSEMMAPCSLAEEGRDWAGSVACSGVLVFCCWVIVK